jgi:hypothetical protein
MGIPRRSAGSAKNHPYQPLTASPRRCNEVKTGRIDEPGLDPVRSRIVFQEMVVIMKATALELELGRREVGIVLGKMFVQGLPEPDAFR